jgi:hypothetical protein
MQGSGTRGHLQHRREPVQSQLWTLGVVHIPLLLNRHDAFGKAPQFPTEYRYDFVRKKVFGLADRLSLSRDAGAAMSTSFSRITTLPLFCTSSLNSPASTPVTSPQFPFT